MLPSVEVLFTSGHDLQHVVDGATAAGDLVELARQAIEESGHRDVVLRDNGLPALGLIALVATAVTTKEPLTSIMHQAQVVDAFGAGDAALAAFIGTRLSDSGLDTAIEARAWAYAFQYAVVGDTWQVRAVDLERRAQTNTIPR